MSKRGIGEPDRKLGPFQDEIGIEAFIEADSSVFLCKSNQVGIAMQLHGVDYACVDDADMAYITDRWRHGVMSFTPEFEIRQYAFKDLNPKIERGSYDHPEVERLAGARADQVSRNGSDLYSVGLFCVILLDIQPVKAIKKGPGILAGNLRDACERLRRAVSSFMRHAMPEIEMTILDKEETFDLFSRLATFGKRAERQIPNTEEIDYAVPVKPLRVVWRDELGREPHLMQGNTYARVMALKILPKTTSENMLSKLYAVPCDCIFASAWRPEHAEQTVAAATWKRGRFWGAAKQSSAKAGEKAHYDEDRMSSGDQLNALLGQIGQNGLRMGHFSLYAVLYGSVDQVRAAEVEITKVFREKQGEFLPDEENQLGGYLAIIPGRRGRDYRRQRISDQNYADLSAIFSLDCGQLWDPQLEAEYLAVFESKPHAGMTGRTPYYFTPVYGDLRHIVIDGSTGSGKTTLLKTIVSNAQKYKPFTAIFDMKHSFHKLTERFGGSSISFARRQCRINPLLLPPGEENAQFLSLFLSVLIDRAGVKMDAEDRENLHRYINIMFGLPKPTRRLGVLRTMLRTEIMEALAPWVEGGQYGWVFDNAEDTINIADWQGFEFEGMDNYEPVVEPLLFYCLHLIRQAVFDPAQASRLKVLVLDEAWRLIKHPMIHAYMEEAVRTYRDRLGMVIICTQSIADLPVCFLEAPYRIYLRHMRVDRELYGRVLNPAALKELESLKPRCEFLLSTPEGARVLQNNASTEELLAYS